MDFGGSDGSIRFVPGGPKDMSVMIPITDDQETENNEPLIVSFSSTEIPQETIPTPTVIIIDNDIREDL